MSTVDKPSDCLIMLFAPNSTIDKNGTLDMSRAINSLFSAFGWMSFLDQVRTYRICTQTHTAENVSSCNLYQRNAVCSDVKWHSAIEHCNWRAVIIVSNQLIICSRRYTAQRSETRANTPPDAVIAVSAPATRVYVPVVCELGRNCRNMANLPCNHCRQQSPVMFALIVFVCTGAVFVSINLSVSAPKLCTFFRQRFGQRIKFCKCGHRYRFLFWASERST